jgi:YVTN family beta-propeller protein
MHILRRALFVILAAAVSLPAQTPSTALLVLNKEGSLAIVDPSSRKVTGRVPTGTQPHEVTVSADGKLAFATNMGTGNAPGKTLSVIDLVSQKEIHRVQLGAMTLPHGIFFANGKAYFTAEGNRMIGAYNPSSDQVEWSLGTGQDGTHMVAVSSDGKQIYTTNRGSNNVAIFEQTGISADWRQTLIAVCPSPEGFDLSPDGKQLWAASTTEGKVSIVDLAAKKLTATFDVPSKGTNRIKITPDGNLALLSDIETGNLVILDAAIRQPVKAIRVGKNPAGILITPDGTRAYVAVTGDNHVAVIDLKKLEIAGRISTGTEPDGMAWAVRK